MTAAIYTRISKDHTGLGQGVERQREDCEQLAKIRGWSDAKVYEDNDVSASGKKVRPRFEELLTAVSEGGIQVIIAWNLDRLTRNRRDTVRLIELCQQHQVTIALARGTDLDMASPMGRMMADQLATWARYEIEQKGERQKRANLQRASKGLPHVTHRPFGFEADCVTVRPDEAETLKLMAKLVLEGNSYQETAWQLNERGLRNSTGGKFIGLVIRRTIQNKRYIGVREYQGIDYPAQWPAIWDDDTWEQLQLTVRLRHQAAAHRPVGRKFLLTGLLWCGNCGQMLTGVTDKHRPGTSAYRIYRCFRLGRTERQGGCGKISRNAEHLETYLKDLLLYRLDSPELAKLLHGKQADNLGPLLNQRSAQQLRIAGLVDDYSTGLLTREQLARAKQTAQAELERIEQEISRLAGRASPVDIPLGQTLAQAWDSQRPEWRRRLLDLVIERVTVNVGNNNKTVRRADGSYYRFNAELVDILWRDGVRS